LATPKKNTYPRTIGKKLKPEYDVRLALEDISAKLDTIVQELQAIKQSMPSSQKSLRR
jgi:superfamily II helicase